MKKKLSLILLILGQISPAWAFPPVAAHFGSGYDSLANAERAQGCVQSDSEVGINQREMGQRFNYSMSHVTSLQSLKRELGIETNISGHHHPTRCGRTHVGYTLSHFETGFKIDMRVELGTLPFERSTREIHEMIEKTRRCLPEIYEVFKRYDLHLNLVLELPDRNRDVSRDASYDTFVTLSDSPLSRSTSHTWLMNEEPYCPILLHKISHLLGLEDEDPSLTEMNPVSIMRNPRSGFETIDLYPRHIQQILGPFCPAGESAPVGLTYRAQTSD
jgi:hypothetical protein